MIEQKVEQVVKEFLADESTFLVDVEVHKQKITVYLDGDKGITIAECTKVCKFLRVNFEEEGTLDDYEVEVTSTGIDRPLRLNRQYVKNVGKKVEVTLQDGTITKGKLEKVDVDKILINEEERNGQSAELKEYLFDNIKQTKLEISF
ncbi:MAG: hypothetical protein JKY33_03885 [Bacteroidia bacterium]|nr:hypothetical protein [Bacteroidia bacterium]